MKTYPNLTSPIKIGNITIKNRMMMAPMDTGFGNTQWGGFTKEGIEYFADIKNGRFRYFTIGIESPVIKLGGIKAIVEYTSVLNANAYGAKGTYRMTGKHHYEKRNSSWILING